jgi:hypothetical protein
MNGRTMASLTHGHGILPRSNRNRSNIPSLADTETHLRAILESAPFRKAPAMSSLLEFLWRQRGAGISEYAVAVEALGKRPDFDPKTDATVRVQVSRLRQKLKEFYDAEGAEFGFQITVPLGGHELDIASNQPVAESRRPSKLTLTLCVASVLAIAFLALAIQNWSLRTRLESMEAERVKPAFWQEFFHNGKAGSIYLPMPVFFEWEGTTLKARDPLVNDFADFHRSKELSELTARWGQPKLLQNYTVTSDTFAAFKLVRYLRAKGIDLMVGSSADLSLEAFNDQNVVLIGIPGTSQHIKQLMEKLPFYSIPGESRFAYNRQPSSGEPERWGGASLSDSRRTTYGILALLPGRAAGSRILMLAGQESYALVSFLISPASLDLLAQSLRTAGSPSYYETVVESEIDGKTVLSAKPVALRVIPATN